ncbi:ANTAR domain-containing protein [Pseudomonas sp. GX19020]|uniref:ANTAR domain-containing response regulator n=1 Tax=Pseudomonas sp. GX19020 TaxID=2942277 RepID=UPI0020192328|nr:ANTAR domain-containing protein [Pseudomonas sp. GX19020]MCL4067158.1 ANTAR domain-containing protein [Pseudomonas sp. GX19020]
MRPGRSEPFASEKVQPFLIRDLRSLSFLLVQPQDSDGLALKSHLERIGCQVQEIWPPPQKYPTDIDIIFVMVDRVTESGQTFHWQADTPSAVLIAVIDYENPLSIDRLLHMRVNAVIGLPIRPFGILTNLLAAVNNHRREQRIRLNLERAQAKLESCRVVERAKLAVMLAEGYPEKVAYAVLREIAMKRRTTVEAISSEVLIRLGWSDSGAATRLSDKPDWQALCLAGEAARDAGLSDKSA